MSDKKECTCECCCEKRLAIQLFSAMVNARKGLNGSESSLWKLLDECVERVKNMK